MESSEILEPMLAPVAAVQRLIEKLDNQGIIIGGIAASLLGQPRLTADTDALFLLSIEEVPYLLELAKAEGLQPRIEDVVEFASRSRVVLLQHKESGIDVDISLGFLPFEVEAVERGTERQTGFLHIRLPTPEDLIILKAVAHRPQDMLDIEAVIVAHPDLDTVRIAFWVKQFADALELPEVWTDIEDLIQRGSAKNTS
jgi:hypothetical protein